MRPSSILIVEDERLVARDLAHRLTQVGYRVAGLEPTGEEALRAVDREHPDLVLMDIHLGGGMDGIAAAAELHRRHGPPVVLLTAYSDKSTLERAQEAAPYGYLLKPVDDRELQIILTMSLARSRAERLVRESERRQRSILENIPDPVWLKDAEGRFMEVNQAQCAVLGRRREDIIGRRLSELMPADLAARFQADDDALLETRRVVRQEMVFPCGSLGERFYDTVMAPVSNEVGDVIGTTGLARDITERKRVEERLRHFEKMEGIGQLAGGMAHEFNNILAALMLNLSLAKGVNQQHELSGYMHEMELLSQRAAGLIRQMLAFSRQSVLNRQPLQLTTVIRDRCELVKPLLGERIQLEVLSEANLPMVNVDQVMVEQVLVNLCLNARDAMAKDGVLRIALERVEVSAEKVSTHPEARAGLHVCLVVTDTGCGMDARTLSRLFEPFFTTKAVGQGMGMGLASIRGIVMQHDGWLEVESEVGRGSTFRVYLPALPWQEGPTGTPAEMQAAADRATVLLVEDEKSVREPTRLLLMQLGYIVHSASSGAEALAVWEQHRDEIDLLYTDVVMPGGLTGMQLADHLLADCPDLKVILTSGYSTEAFAGQCRAGVPMTFLPKPCPPTVLAEAIRQCLRRPANPGAR